MNEKVNFLPFFGGKRRRREAKKILQEAGGRGWRQKNDPEAGGEKNAPEARGGGGFEITGRRPPPQPCSSTHLHLLVIMITNGITITFYKSIVNT